MRDIKRSIYIALILSFGIFLVAVLADSDPLKIFSHLVREGVLFFWIALAAALVIAQGKIDISYFGQIPFYGMSMLVLQNFDVEFVNSLLVLTLLTIMIALIQWALVCRLPGWSLIISLSVGFTLSGICIATSNLFFYQGGIASTIHPDWVSSWRELAPYLPMIPLLIVVWLLTTLDGLRFLAVGENSVAANYLKLSKPKYLFLAYIMSGVLAGVGSLELIINFSSGGWSPKIGAGQELLAVAAVVVSGGSLRGGRLNAISLLMSCLLIVGSRTAANRIGGDPELFLLLMGTGLAIVVVLEALKGTEVKR